jgi:SNF2 family DNA or RNA helicase
MAVYTKLMQHQNDIVEFCKDKPYAGIFAEYGTGKTLCTLKLTEVCQWTKVLVVCSKTAILATWPAEITKHTDFNYVYLVGSKQKRIDALSLGLRKARQQGSAYTLEYLRPTIFLINFDGVKSIYNELVASSMDCIIVDESTKIKYPTTDRTKVLWALSKNIPRRFCLTGWPITESPQDLYSQIKFLDRGVTFGNSYHGFMDKYFAKIGYKRVPIKGAPEEIINKVGGFCIRVTNESLNLPPKTYIVKEITQSQEQMNALRQLKDYMQIDIGKINISTEYVFTKLIKTLEICDGFVKDNWWKLDGDVIFCNKCGAKEEYAVDGEKTEEGKRVAKRIECIKCGHAGNSELVPTQKDEALFELLEEIDVAHHKVIIWTPFKFTLLKLSKLCEHYKYSYVTLSGETEDVKGVVDKFMFSKTNILIATTKKASESLNLTNCNVAIYYSNEWSYDRRANSEARIYRKGSEKHAHVIYVDFVTKGTLEELVFNCLTKKKNLVDELKEMFGREAKQ